MIIGYAQVSSKDQNLTRQAKDLEDFGCEKIFTEKQSAKKLRERTVYNDMRKKLRFGDVLVVHELNCFGRNKKEIRDEWESLMQDKIDIVVLNMPILDTRKYKKLEGVRQLVIEIVLSLLSWMVEEERVRIRSAQREGIENAKRQGKYTGRKRKYHAKATGKDKLIYEAIVEGLHNKTSVMDIHRQTGVSRSTIYVIKSELDI